MHTGMCHFLEAGAEARAGFFVRSRPTASAGRAHTRFPYVVHLAPARPPGQLQVRTPHPRPTRFTSARIPPASPPQVPWQLSLPVLHFRLGAFMGGSGPLARRGRDLLGAGGVASHQGAGPNMPERRQPQAVPSPG